jgi:hypothetical protein
MEEMEGLLALLSSDDEEEENHIILPNSSTIHHNTDLTPSSVPMKRNFSTQHHQRVSSTPVLALSSNSFLPAAVEKKQKVATFIPDDSGGIEEYTKLALSSRCLSSVDVQMRLTCCRVLTIQNVNRITDPNQMNGTDWSVFAVIINRSDIRTSQKGEKYCIFKLIDLNTMDIISLFTFGAAFHQYYTLESGLLICCLNPKVLQQKANPFINKNKTAAANKLINKFQSFASTSASTAAENMNSLSLSTVHSILSVGKAKDFAFCAAYKKEQFSSNRNALSFDKCSNPVNLSRSQYCDYHVAQQYSKIQSKRSDVNKTSNALPFQKHSNKLMNQQRANERDEEHTFNPIAKQIYAGGMQLLNNNADHHHHQQQQQQQHAGNNPLTASRSAQRFEAYKMKQQHKEQIDNFHNKTVGEQLKEFDQSLTTKPHNNTVVKPQKINSNFHPTIQGSNSTNNSAATKVAAIKAQQPLDNITNQLNNPAIIISSNPLNLTMNQAAGAKASVLSVGEKLQRVRQSKALQQIAAAGGNIPKPDPNSLQSSNKASKASKRKLSEAPSSLVFNSDGSIKPADYIANSAGSVEESAATAAERVKKNRLEQLFGLNLPNGEGASLEKLLQQKSLHSELVTEKFDEERLKQWNEMQKKEEIITHMQSIKQITTTAYSCKQCASLNESPLQICLSKGHTVSKVSAIKRWFECDNCKNRDFTLASKVVLHNCHKCGENQWKASTMLSAAVNSAVPTRKELVLKEEEIFSLRQMF